MRACPLIMIRKEFRSTNGEVFSLLTNENTNPTKSNFVFFHATGFNAHTYSQFLNSLDAKFKNSLNVIALDQRGHGLSIAKAEPNELKTWSTYVDDALELVDSMEGPLVCMGHSMGAVIAAKVASLRKTRVSHLIMAEPVLWSPFQSMKFRIQSRLNFKRPMSIADGAAKRRSSFENAASAIDSYVGRGAFTTWEKQWIADYINGGTKDNLEGGIELTCTPAWESKTFRSSSMDTWRYLKKIKIPCYVPCGEFGSTFSDEARISLRKLGNNWILDDFKDSSHFLPMEFSEELIDRIHAFMSK